MTIGGTWGPEITQEAVNTFVLPVEIPDPQEEVEDSDDEEWKRKVDEDFEKQIQEVLAVITNVLLVLLGLRDTV